MKLDLSQLSSDKPIITLLAAIGALVAIVVGGVVTITNPQSLSFHQYVQDIAFMAGALGLGAGVGRGIDSHAQATAQAAQQQGAPMTETPAPEPTPDPTPAPEPAPDPEPAPAADEPTGGVDPHYEPEPPRD